MRRFDLGDDDHVEVDWSTVADRECLVELRVLLRSIHEGMAGLAHCDERASAKARRMEKEQFVQRVDVEEIWTTETSSRVLAEARTEVIPENCISQVVSERTCNIQSCRILVCFFAHLAKHSRD